MKVATRSLSGFKFRVSQYLNSRVYWNIMGRLKPVPAVTSEYRTVEECLASGETVVRLLERLDVVSRGAATLQIGSGLGRVEYHLRSRVRRCYGIDVSPSMVKRARRLVPFDNVEFFLSDGKSLDAFQDGLFQLIYSFFVFQHLPRQQFSHYVTDAYSKLSPGGHFVFQMMIDESGSSPEPPASHPYGLRRYTTAAVRAILTDAGFGPIDCFDLDGSPLGDPLEGSQDVVFRARRPDLS